MCNPFHGLHMVWAHRNENTPPHAYYGRWNRSRITAVRAPIQRKEAWEHIWHWFLTTIRYSWAGGGSPAYPSSGALSIVHVPGLFLLGGSYTPRLHLKQALVSGAPGSFRVFTSTSCCCRLWIPVIVLGNNGHSQYFLLFVQCIKKKKSLAGFQSICFWSVSYIKSTTTDLVQPSF